MASFQQLGNGTFRAALCVDRKRVTASFKTMDEAERWATAKEMALRRKAGLQNDLISRIPLRVLEAIASTTHTHGQIVSGAIEYDSSSGIYFLIRDSEVIYVGKSVNVFSRIGAHRREGGAWFDSFNVIRCAVEDLDATEERYILALMPRMNSSVAYQRRAGAHGVFSPKQQTSDTRICTADSLDS